MKKRFFTWAVAAAIAVAGPMFMVSCSDNDGDGDGEMEFLNPQEEASIEPCNTSTAFISDMSSEKYSRVVNAMFPHRVSIDQAEVAVVTSDEIGTLDGKIFSVYERGGTIVVIKPNGEEYEAFAEFYGLEKKMSKMNFGEILAFAFNKSHHYYTLYDDMNEENHDEQHYVRKLNRLSWWLTELHQPAQTRSASAASTSKALLDTISISSPDQTYTYTIPVYMKNTIMKQASSKPDEHEKSGDIDVKLSVWYAYGNSGNIEKCQGDYYFVKCDVTAHNSDVWAPYSKLHGGVRSYIVGYFMRQMQLCAKLMNPEQGFENLTSFYSDPKPQTSEGQTTYSHTDGWTLGGGVTVSGGYSQDKGKHIEAAGNFSFNHTWNFSEQTTVKDVKIQNNSKNGVVDMNFIIGNLNQAGEKHFENIDTYYNDVCRSNVVFTYSCAWRIPIGKWGVQDRSDKKFWIHIWFFPQYGTDHWKAGKGTSFNRDTWVNQNTDQKSGWSEFDVFLSSPDRTPYGILSIKNGVAITQNTVLSDIKIWKNEDEATEENVYKTISSTYGPGETVTTALEAGTKYKIQYKLTDTSQFDPETGTYKILGTYLYENVDIHTGQDESSATTEISSVDGKAKKIEE